MPSRNSFLALIDSCFLKELEERYVYNVATDELYEVSPEAFEFLKRCDGSRKLAELPDERDFLNYCFAEGLLIFTSEGKKRDFVVERAPIPSLRYLELQITARCNLKCKHCYLGPAINVDLPSPLILKALTEFEKMQGLRLLLSGGEPLLHPEFWQLNDLLPRFGFRSVLLTNGTLLDKAKARRLKVHEVQVSLDGLSPSHDALRGPGSFAKALAGIRVLRELGKEVSVATMVHRENLKDFAGLKELLRELEIKEWNVDVPCLAGHLRENPDLYVSYQEAAPFLRYSYGGGLYSSSPGYTCGAHLCAVTPYGQVAKCGFFSDTAAGDVAEGLANCWQRIAPLRVDDLDCDCSFLEECRGGCRYRAMLYRDLHAPDPVQCYARGVRPS